MRRIETVQYALLLHPTHGACRSSICPRSIQALQEFAQRRADALAYDEIGEII
jgi:hypothetical protein